MWILVLCAASNTLITTYIARFMIAHFVLLDNTLCTADSVCLMIVMLTVATQNYMHALHITHTVLKSSCLRWHHH
jgi:hypothetical protein